MNRPSRSEARRALGLQAEGHLCLYAGNLDGYQGWKHLLEALAMLRTTHVTASLLIATESDPDHAQQQAHRLRIGGSVHFRRLDGEKARALAHAASDLSWIPRRIEGGVPIKMLDAFARGVPVIAMERANAGLCTEGACMMVKNDDPGDLAAAARRLLDDGRTRDSLREGALRYLSTHHGTAAFDGAMQALLGLAPTRAPMRSARRRRASVGPLAR